MTFLLVSLVFYFEKAVFDKGAIGSFDCFDLMKALTEVATWLTGSNTALQPIMVRMSKRGSDWFRHTFNLRLRLAGGVLQHFYLIKHKNSTSCSFKLKCLTFHITEKVITLLSNALLLDTVHYIHVGHRPITHPQKKSKAFFWILFSARKDFKLCIYIKENNATLV